MGYMYHTSLTKQGSGNFSEEEMGEPEEVDDLKKTMLLSAVGQLPMNSQGLWQYDEAYASSS